MCAPRSCRDEAAGSRNAVPLWLPSASHPQAACPHLARPVPHRRAHAALQLLVRWEMEHHVMSERIYWSTAPSPVVRPVGPSPNTRTDEGAVRHWLALSDAYTWPHVQYFDSVEHLARMLQAATPARLRNISAHMRQHTRAHDAVVRAHWAGALGRVLNSQAPGTLAVPDDLDTELERRFGLELPRAEPSCARDSAPDQGVWA